MSNKEQALLEKLATLPAEVQDKFLAMAQGAAVAIETMDADKKDDGAKEEE